MPKKSLVRLCGFAALFLCLSAPAYAGFQWVSPEEAEEYQSLSQDQGEQGDVVVSSAEDMGLVPVVISGSTALSPSVGEGSVGGDMLAGDVISRSSAPPVPLVSPVVVPAKEAGAVEVFGEDIVKGFASQIPLSLAVRQVLPIGYNFTLESGVDGDTLVSYKGGRAWRETMKDLLAPTGLVMREKGSEIAIGRGAASLIGAADNRPVSLQNNVAPVVPAVAPVVAPAANMAAVSIPVSGGVASDGVVAAMAPSVIVPDSSVVVPDAVGSGGWNAERGQMLRSVLSDWCGRAGVELQWMAEYDYPLGASMSFSEGVGFEGAVRGILAGFEAAKPQPVGELYNNSSAGQKVLVVQARGNSYSN